MAAATVTIIGCRHDAPAAAGWTGERSTRGDTVTVFSRTPVTPEADSAHRLPVPTIVWTSDSLMRPIQIEPGPDSLLFVADGWRIFVLGRGGTLVTVLGRRGDGPGEFRRIQGVHFLPPDTLLAWDGNTRRLSWLGLDGRLLKSVTMMASPGYGSPRPGRPVAWGAPSGPGDSVLISWAAGMVRVADTPDSLVIVAAPLTGGPPRRLLALADIQWADFGSVLGPARAYAPRSLYAFGSRGAIAVADGMEACVTLHRPGEPPLEMCREWTRGKVGPEERSAEVLARLDASDQQRTFLTAMIEGQEYPELRNSIADLVFGMRGRIWTRMVDSTARMHPMIEGQFPEVRPEAYRWTVFGEDGRWETDVMLPSEFQPLLIDGKSMWGVIEDQNGAPAIATIAGEAGQPSPMARVSDGGRSD